MSGDVFTEADVEVAARAICVAQNGDPDEYEGGTTPAWRDYEREAHAALTAVAPGLVARATEQLQAEVADLRADLANASGEIDQAVGERDDARARLAAVETFRDEIEWYLGWVNRKTVAGEPVGPDYRANRDRALRFAESMPPGSGYGSLMFARDLFRTALSSADPERRVGHEQSPRFGPIEITSAPVAQETPADLMEALKRSVEVHRAQSVDPATEATT